MRRKSEQFLTQSIHFVEVLDGQLFQNRQASRSQGHNYNAAIRRVGFAPNQSSENRAINESDYRVMPFLQELCQLRYRGLAGAIKTRDAQHELMLLRRNFGVAGRTFAEAHEFAQLVTESREFGEDAAAVDGFSWGSGLSHISNISRRDILRNRQPRLAEIHELYIEARRPQPCRLNL